MIQVADIRTGDFAGSYPSDLTVVSDTLFFTAVTESAGRELWMSDGTAPGKRMVTDLYRGAFSSYPDNLTAVGGALYFQADDGVYGAELWRLVEEAPYQPGDTDGDGDVDLVDLNNVRNHFGAIGDGILGDSNRDGRVDLADLNDVRNKFGAGGPAPAPGAVTAKAKEPLPKIPSTSIRTKPNTAAASLDREDRSVARLRKAEADAVFAQWGQSDRVPDFASRGQRGAIRK